MRRTRFGLSALVVVLAMVAAACSGGETEEALVDVRARLDAGGGQTTETTVAAAEYEAEGGEEAGPGDAAGGDEAGLGDGALSPVVLQTIDLGRDIIFTAELTVTAPDVAAATEEATRAIQSLGGFVFGQQTSGSPEARSVITFKIRPEDFQEALDRLGSIGELRSQTVAASDVTDRIVDLESRINTAEASVQRLRALLADATSVEVIAELENQLLERETQLETLRGQLRTLEDQVALATIVLVITETSVRPVLDVSVTAYPGHDGAGLSCPGEGSIAVDEGDPATLCVEVVNAGDVPVGELELRDPVLDVDLADAIVVVGDPAEVIEPGQSVIVAVEVSPERDLRTRTTVSAVAVDDEGNPLEGRSVSSTVGFFLDTADPGGIPGFGDGLAASWQFLLSTGRLLTLMAGWVIPFLWLPLLLWLGWRLWDRRRPPAVEEQKELTGAGV